MGRQLMGLVAVMTLIGLANSARAQDSAAGADVTADGMALDPITIFATLSPIAAFDYPGQVEVVDRERLETLQPSSLADVFQGIPGTIVDGGPRRAGQTPAVRGLSEDNVLVLLDGARQSFISGHEGRVFIEPDLIKQVEVVKGPISSLYGSGALGGVVALTTVDAKDFLAPGETMGYRVKGEYQSVDNEFLISTTTFARSKDGKFDVVGNISYRDTGDIRLGDGTILPDSNHIASGLLKGTVQLSPDLSLNSSWIHYQNHAVTPDNPQYGNIAGVPNGEVTPIAVFRHIWSDTMQSTLSYKPDNNLFDGNLQVYRTRNEVSDADVDDDRVVSRTVVTTGVKADNRSRFDLSNDARLTLTYGAEYYHDDQVGRDNTDDGGDRAGVPTSTADFAGVFTQAEFKFLSPGGLPGEFTLLPGARFDSFTTKAAGEETNDDTAISPKIGISYKPVPWLLLFGNYGKAFRAPSFNELFAEGVHFNLGPGLSNDFIPNPDLRPQDGSTIEAGIGFEFKDMAQTGDKFSVKGSYWKSKVDNFIDLDVVGLGEHGESDLGCIFLNGPCHSQFVNIAHAELHGVEVSARYDIDRFYGIATYASIDGRDTDSGEYLGVLQPDKLYFDLGMKLPEYWARVGTRLTFADDFTKVNGVEAPRDGYHTIGLYAAIEPGDGPLKGLRLDLGVDNLTDEDYEVVAPGAKEPGINFKAAMSWTQKW